MKISITNDDGEVFAIHCIDGQAAEHLRYRLHDVLYPLADRPPREPDHQPGDVVADDFLTDLTAAIAREMQADDQ